MAWSPALWFEPPFPTCPIHDDEFSLREVSCVLSWVQWQEFVLWQGFPTSTLLASWVAQPPCSQHPTLSSQMCVTTSCEHLHKFSIRAGIDSAGHYICVTGRGEQGILMPNTVCRSQTFSWVLFQTLEIFIKSSQIFRIYHFGYIVDRSKLMTVVCNPNHILYGNLKQRARKQFRKPLSRNWRVLSN